MQATVWIMSTDETLRTCAQHHDRQTRQVCPRCGRPACDLCLDLADDWQVCASCRHELAAGAPGSQVRAPGRSGAPVTFALLAAYVVVYVAGLAGDDLAQQILLLGEQNNELVMQGEWWRVLSATMLHSGVTHLFFNGYALYALGAELERGVGSGPFAALYVASGLAGGLAYLVAAPGGIAVGASGAIFGLFGAWFAALWVNRDTPRGRAGLSQFAVLLLINLALPLFVPNIGWQAHLGGLMAGAVIGLRWARRGRRAGAVTPSSRVGPPVVMAVALLLFLLWYTMIQS
jgi:membrane associated rhomboid family serine protease